ncbi:MAG: hypothetical protein ACLQD9_05255 [Thermoplasmata archaeon]|nr:hypothetical protein [Thermoplasmata archaeon]
MIAGLLGRCLRLVAKLSGGDAGADLDCVGAELVRLENRRVQVRATSR